MASTNMPAQIDTASSDFSEELLYFNIDRNIAHLQSLFDAATPDIPTMGSLPPPRQQFSNLEVMQIGAIAIASVFVLGVNLFRSLNRQ